MSDRNRILQVSLQRTNLIRTILFLSTSSGPGGAEQVISNLAASLDSAKYRAVLCVFRPGWLQERSLARGIPTYVIPTQGMTDWRWMLRFRQLLKDESVDLIHAHEFDAIVQGTAAASYSGIPIVATVHGKHYYWEKFRRRLAYRWVSRRATVVAVSNDLKTFIERNVGIARQRIQVIYNGVEPFSLHTAEDILDYKAQLGIPPGEKVVGIVGSLYPVKGHRYLLEAVPSLLQRFPRTTFLIVGRGALDETLKAQAEELGIDKKVLFLGLRQDIPRLLAVMDVFAHPSLSEGLSMAILEAMMAAKPVVATNVGGNPELLVHGATGFLVQPKNSAALVECVGGLLQDPALARNLGASGRDRAMQLFSLKAMATQYQSLYMISERRAQTYAGKVLAKLPFLRKGLE